MRRCQSMIQILENLVEEGQEGRSAQLMKEKLLDMKKQQLVTQIIEFCRDNQLQSLAEGVETAQEMKTVIRLGVDLIQGYYYSKPISAEEFETYMLKNKIRDI